MHLDEFQRLALGTDQAPPGHDNDVLLPMLGVAGEIGTLLVEHKKFLRDGEAYRLYPARVAEELGDILWYVSNLASKFGLSLDDVARDNLAKVADRFGRPDPGAAAAFDDDFPDHERLPVREEFTFAYATVSGREKLVVRTSTGHPLGDPLTDNAHVEDAYRFHDVFHLTFATLLGWSPVTRRNLSRKRRSSPQMDEIEDGGRAIVIEEAIVAYMFEHARHHDFFATVSSIDFSRLKTIKSLTEGLEVSVRSTGQWEHALLEGFRLWRLLRDADGGTVRCDRELRVVTFVSTR